ncbi:MAG TPA: hypothetical protein PKA16_07575 [Ottowia sp.]|nr:hypothetical protein [Ottowia sp.]HMN21237.1 hypothetical protein [Ottowia sp.]
MNLKPALAGTWRAHPTGERIEAAKLNAHAAFELFTSGPLPDSG